jgi:hypothetical protein
MIKEIVSHRHGIGWGRGATKSVLADHRGGRDFNGLFWRLTYVPQLVLLRMHKPIQVVFFRLDYESKIVLLHGIVKKSQKTPANELATAKRRLTKLRL